MEEDKDKLIIRQKEDIAISYIMEIHKQLSNNSVNSLIRIKIILDDLLEKTVSDNIDEAVKIIKDKNPSLIYFVDDYLKSNFEKVE